MNVEECIVALINRLKFFGYNRFQVRNIISEAIGEDLWVRNNSVQNMQILNTMKKYEILGNDYLQVYSK